MRDTAELLQQLMQALSGAPGWMPTVDGVSGESPNQVSSQSSSALLAQIRALLREDDAGALELWESHTAVFKSLVADAQAFEEAITGFDFEAALRMLDQAEAESESD